MEDAAPRGAMGLRRLRLGRRKLLGAICAVGMALDAGVLVAGISLGCAQPRRIPGQQSSAAFASGPSRLLLRLEPRRPLSRAARAKKAKALEPFAFDADLDDHCETPSNAYRHVAPLLRVIAQQLHPGETSKVASSRLRIYDPYYCLGGVKKKLGRLGFDHVYNENEDFYAVANSSELPDFDVLVTNPPFSTDRHLSAALRFALARRKPWLTILPAHSLFSDHYTESLEMVAEAFPQPPFYIVPRKKYNFKTPSPLPPPPTEFRPKARTRSRVADTLWCVHGGHDAELHEALIALARRHVALGDCTVVADLKAMPRDVAPKKFTVEMRRNAEIHNYALG